MKLYKIILNYQGKDLDAKVTGWYITAENEEQVYEHISSHQFEDYESDFGAWAEYYSGEQEVKDRILKNKGDFDEEYMGEFNDTKYGWEQIGEITSEEIEVLKKFKIL